MNKKSRITVIGSSNTDMVVMTSHFPAPGETILGGEFLMNAGGKGANQAVAATRCGGEVFFIGKVGREQPWWLLFGEFSSGKSSRMHRKAPTRSSRGCLSFSSPA